MNSARIEEIIQYRIAKFVPTIDKLNASELKHYIFANRKQEAQRQNLRNAWRCGKQSDFSLALEQEFSLYKDLVGVSATAENLKAILIQEIKASLKKELELQLWMQRGGEVP